MHDREHRVGHIIREYRLTLGLLALFLATWAGQTWAGWVEFAAEREAAGHAAQFAGPDGYLWRWLASTLENWQAEFLHLLLLVAITTFLLTKGDADTREGHEQVRQSVARIERRLEAMTSDDRGQRPAA